MPTEREITGLIPQWCPGCGHYGFLSALKKAIVELDLDPANVFLVSGIGCSGRISHYIKVTTFHTLHGRPVPPAVAAKIVNPELNVIAVSGDGDAFAIGISHFIHAARRNADITYVILNNMIYGLTTGQYSPTSLRGQVTKTSPQGNREYPIDGVKIALAAGATFVARGFSGNIQQLVDLTKKAIQHKGFSYLEVLSPCVTFNRIATYQWFREHTIDVNTIEKYDPTDMILVLKTLADLPRDKIPIGLIYIDTTKKPFHEEILKDPSKPISLLDLDPSRYNYEELLKGYV